MKHHIVITKGQFIVENMFSKIATPSELRTRLTKKFPGKYAIYFRTVDPQYGMFFVNGQRYFWFIDSCTEPKNRKPKPKSEMHLVREPQRLSLLCPTCDPYKLYENDVFSIPDKDSWVIAAQKISPNSSYERHLIQGTLNGKMSWINACYLRRVFDTKSEYDAVMEAAGKTIRITEAIQYSHDPEPGHRGLLSGKPITWWLRPRLYPGYSYKYEII